jgi:hypothetical protein
MGLRMSPANAERPPLFGKVDRELSGTRRAGIAAASRAKPRKAIKRQASPWLFAAAPWLLSAFWARKSQGKPTKAKESQGLRWSRGARRAGGGGCPADVRGPRRDVYVC